MSVIAFLVGCYLLGFVVGYLLRDFIVLRRILKKLDAAEKRLNKERRDQL